MATREDTKPTTHTEYEQEVARIAQQNINVSPVRACTRQTRGVHGCGKARSRLG